MPNPLTRLVPHLVGEYPKPFNELFKKVTVPNGNNREEIKRLLWKAYEFSYSHHEGQKRRSGKPYFEHCLAVANLLALWKMDHTTIIGGLLHDVLEDTDATMEELERLFDQDVAVLVDGVTKLGGIQFSSRKEKQAGNFMKLLLSVAKDLRVIIIKFADRLHNMQTLQYMPQIKQHRIAIETRDVYAPLAHRLGMAKVKWQLDDLVFKTLNPTAYKEIDSKLKATNRQRTRYINEVIKPVKAELASYGIKAEIYGRPKSHASIYGKMVQRGKTFEEIYDLYAIRIIVEKVEQCYLTLGIIHQLYSPVQERFKDFIAMPKSNGYQSIHTTIIGPKGNMVEIQIRTQEMEQTAEIGVAAHWRYKENQSVSTDLDSNIKWLRELVEILQSESADPKEFMHLLKIDLFDNEIFVFTPNGDLIELPINATPIDFAFQIHTELGLHCIGAKVNHKVVPLNTKLKNGDMVEIITSQNQQPSYGWLKFVVTTKARNLINRHLRKMRRVESIKIGSEILEKTLRRLKMLKLMKEIKESYELFGYNSPDSLLEAIGNGSLTVRDIFRKIRPAEEIMIEETEEESQKRFIDYARSSTRGIKLQGITNLMVSFGKCCNPIPGDEMIGFVTRGRGITVHRASCRSLPLLNEESDRLIPVEWDVRRRDVFNVRIKVVGEDRRGALKEMTECISSENLNISSVDLKVKDNIATAYFIIEVNNLRQLDRIIRKLTKIKGIDYVERTGK
ncbi:MAG: bifunctional (p)ppGpp synthetase/guanosine-3',5'-bis(diphosphate) 3'-pyrophosphohydrolase [FCB group bacterium]|nr:bifunctional (p)ppGpp synthetase/guanosine-3',5'-bis(diphosphate) 3'-pyrophosphohydrolase [FCB group bacterium]